MTRVQRLQVEPELPSSFLRVGFPAISTVPQIIEFTEDSLCPARLQLGILMISMNTTIKLDVYIEFISTLKIDAFSEDSDVWKICPGAIRRNVGTD